MQKNNLLNFYEFQNLVVSFDNTITIRQVKDLFKIFDQNTKDDVISQEEFVQVMSKYYIKFESQF